MKYIIVLATLLFIGCNHSETIKPETNEHAELVLGHLWGQGKFERFSFRSVAFR